MAKCSLIERNKKRERLAKKYADKYAQLKKIVRDSSLPAEERFNACLKLTQLPRNASRTRVRNLCQLTGRTRGFYRKFKLSRIALRQLGAAGQIPGLTKASW